MLFLRNNHLWAGLCNGEFYKYVRLRWNYSSLRPKKPERDASTVVSRFFFTGGGLSGKYRNTIARYWWVGESTYNAEASDHWKDLDIIGPEDFASKVNDIFYSNTFAANPEILDGICKALAFFRSRDQRVLVKEQLRPALQYLNALGGGVLLDALSSDDIAAIMTDIIGKIRNGERGDFFKEESVSDDTTTEDDSAEEDSTAAEVNVDYQEEQEALDQEAETVDVNEVLGAPKTVERGCSVIVEKQSNHKEFLYNIPTVDGDRPLYGIEQLMLGKSVGDSVKVRLETYTIKTIRW